MRVLVACEFSGVVREAFLARGHDAYSCDLLPSLVNKAAPGRHLQCDVRSILRREWDLVIAHPPCTYLARSGVGHLFRQPGRWDKMMRGALFFRECLNANAPKVCVENPILHRFALKVIGREHDCVVQPYEHGHPVIKTTRLWLKNLPPLTPTRIVGYNKDQWHKEVPDKRMRWMVRSVTYEGIARAMAEQWG